MSLEATEGDQKAAGILGWISLGTGIGSAVTGLGAAKLASKTASMPNRWAKKIKSPERTKGTLIFEESPGSGDVVFHENLWNRGIVAYETHGDFFGNLMDSTGKFTSASEVAVKDILPRLNAMNPPLAADKPLLLVACWGGRYGAAQKVADILKRPVISYRHTVTIRDARLMNVLSVPKADPLRFSNLIKEVRTNPFVRLKMRLQGIQNNAIAQSRYYFPR
jgi:hypothetical protein